MLVTAAVLAGAWLSPAPAAAQAVLRVAVVSDAGERHGACVLVHRTNHDRDVTLYFLTAAGLFTRADGTHAHVRSIAIDGSAAPIDVAPEDVTLPEGNAVDVAIVRAATRASALVPEPIDFRPPAAGDAFSIVGPQGPVDRILEHARFVSTRLLVGDRDASELEACVGAPAVAAGGIFGIVSDCRAQRVPLVSLLPLARSFLAAHVPGLGAPHDTGERR
jgi:hypothetical protein